MNLEQLRAKHAYAAAAKQAASKDFLQLARSLPQTFQTNGLLATWAFLLSKAKKPNEPHGPMLDALVEYFVARRLVNAGVSADDLLLRHWTDRQRSLSTEQLQIRTAEAIAFAGWIKRAAEALCDQEERRP